MGTEDARRTARLGAISIAFYAIHAATRIADGHPESLLWACHLGSLWVGLGLVFRRPTLVGIGVMWLALGVPLWIMDLAVHWEFDPTSYLTHLGGLAIGLIGIRRLGLPRPVWWKAVAALLLLHFVSRWATPEEANINLAHRVWPGWEPYFPSHAVYILVVTAISLALFGAVEYALRRTGFSRRRDD